VFSAFGPDPVKTSGKAITSPPIDTLGFYLIVPNWFALLNKLKRRKKIKTGPSAGSGFSESDEMIIQV
jgi:hypothetical protein